MIRRAIAGCFFLIVAYAARGATSAVPVYLDLKPPNGGSVLSLSATCTGLSKRECTRFSKPVSVLVRDPALGSNLLPDFIPTPSGNNWTLNLTEASPGPAAPASNPGSVLRPGRSVKVIYDEGKLQTPWEPVLPTGAQVFIGGFQRTEIRACVPIDTTDHGIVVQVQNAAGPKLIGITLSRGMSDARCQYWWLFSASNGEFDPDDAVTISTEVDGQLDTLVKGTVPGTVPGTPPPTPPASGRAAAAVPMPSAAGSSKASLPAVTSPGPCAPPNVVLTNSTTVTVTFSCKPNPGGKVLYVDNVAKSEPRDLTWADSPANPFLYTATLATPLLAYQLVKVLELDPAQATAETAPVMVPGPPPAAPPPGKVAWWVAPPLGACLPPTVVAARDGDMSLTVRFTDPNAATTCHPDLSQTQVFVNNDAVNAQWLFSVNAVLTYIAKLDNPLQQYQRVKVLQKNPAQNVADSPSVVVGAPAAGAPAAPAAPAVISTGPCADAYIQSAPGLTDSVSVIVGCMPGNPNNNLHLFVNGKQYVNGNSPDSGVTWSLTGTSPLTFTAKLSSKLKDGDSVYAVEDQQRDLYSATQVASGPPKPPPSSSIQTVQEGATSVTGYAPGLDKVRVQIVDGNNLRQQVDASVDSTTNQFTASFSNPLQAEQQLELYGVSKSGTQSESATPLEVQALALDWGRVRGYFTAGILLSNNNSQLNLSNANTFLGFNVDKQWLHRAPSFSQNGDSFLDRFAFNTYFDARLTAIAGGTTGSSSSGGTPTLSTGGSTGSTTGSTSGTTSTTSSTGNPSPNTTSLLTNSQAAALQIGAYLPFTVDSWDFRERHYSLFVAPIAKVGFYTLTDSGNISQQSAENANRATSTFFPFYSYGLRIGHRREYDTDDGRSNRNRSPEQLSYLDVSVGKWSNFEYLQPFNFTTSQTPACTQAATDPTTAACDIRNRLWRYGFEGLLIIPNTPLVVGFSANVSAQRPRGLFNYLSPPDDLRFLFGVRFDASKLTGVLTKLGNSQ